MAFTRKYPAGALIYFEGDRGDEIYVLKDGQVNLTYRGIESLAYVNERLKVGDFFGVKSSLGRYGREETARVHSDATVMVLTIKEFEDLALKNLKLVLKMLKIFSTQLRKIGKQAAALLTTTGEPVVPSLALLRVGDYYLKNKKFEQAIYAFSKYIEHYPDGEHVEQTKQRIESARRGVSIGLQSMDDESEDGELSDESSGEMEFPDEDDSSDGDMFLDEEETEGLTVSDNFSSAMNLVSAENYEDAISKFTEIENQDVSANDKHYKEDASFEKSKCYIELEQYENAIKNFTEFIKNNPKTEKMKLALFNIGKSHQGLGNNDKAIGFYKKVAGLPPQEALNDEAKEKISQLEQ